jgi:hypothetical protein
MRRLGVYSENLPTKTTPQVQPANFSIAGLLGLFERKYAAPVLVTNQTEALAALGAQIDSSAYGPDALNGFFTNLVGTQGSIYVLSYKGTGAVAASASLNNLDSPAEPCLKLSSAYQGIDDYGLSGNRTGYTVTNGSAFSTAVTTLPSGTGDPARIIILASVVGVKVGDVIKISKTGYSEFHYVTEVNENAKTVKWADSDYAGTGVAADYTVDVWALQIKTYRKDINGVVSEVDVDLGKTWITFNSADSGKYIQNVFARSSWLKAALLTVTGGPTAAQIYPADVATITYLASGAVGTLPASASDWAILYPLFNGLPIRWLANCETSNATYQAALEAYCAGRSDNPIAVLVGAQSMTKAQAVAAGQSFQRSNEVDAVFVHNWLAIPDPFATSPTAPYRTIPNVGHIMGWWINSVQSSGIHVIPARKNHPLLGVSDVYGEQGLDDYTRTDMANAGTNVIQNMSGRGIIVRNLFTLSTDKAFRYSNAILMRNYVKISGIDSLQDSENTPNDIGHVREDRMAFLQFMHRLWGRGSTGNIKEGETFGQYEKSSGVLSTEEESYEVIADATNNPVTTLQAGERNIDIWFMFPAPAGSIKIGVGLIYRVAE